jgi:hypothetical protein
MNPVGLPIAEFRIGKISRGLTRIYTDLKKRLTDKLVLSSSPESFLISCFLVCISVCFDPRLSAKIRG